MDETPEDHRLAMNALNAGASESIVLALLNKDGGESALKKERRAKRSSMVSAVAVYFATLMYIFLVQPFEVGRVASNILSISTVGVFIVVCGNLLYKMPRAWGARNYRRGNQHRTYPTVALHVLGWTMLITALLIVVVATFV